MRAVLVTSLLVLMPVVSAQETSAFGVAWECTVPEENVLCLDASSLLQFGLRRDGARPAEPGLAFGAGLQVQTRQEGVEVRASLALWYEAVMQLGLLEAYTQMDFEEFGLSLGKRRDYSGPWDDTLMGRDGRWGVFAGYTPAEIPWLGVEVAYLPSAGMRGGQAFVGSRLYIFRLGAFVEVVQASGGLGALEPSIRVNPRLGLQGQQVEVFWQQDRGFWSTASLPLPLGQALGHVLKPPFDAQTQAWIHALDQGRVEWLVWWNPAWEHLGEGSPFRPERRLEAWLQEPRKLLVGVAYNWNDQMRLGMDLSRAPVEAVRLYLQVYWR
jgi:hypothetical protein